ncbi:DNA polymerase POL [Marssonina coronariae]|uniref:DNA polymerase POL n=1 Tax=Diplocarpon coronariae TaxID=2795749 RepID=A0A218Z3K8_9HELO|nr:DNA polymerase POL [Marssonina coronariae]
MFKCDGLPWLRGLYWDDIRLSSSTNVRTALETRDCEIPLQLKEIKERRSFGLLDSLRREITDSDGHPRSHDNIPQLPPPTHRDPNPDLGNGRIRTTPSAETYRDGKQHHHRPRPRAASLLLRVHSRITIPLTPPNNTSIAPQLFPANIPTDASTSTSSASSLSPFLGLSDSPYGPNRLFFPIQPLLHACALSRTIFKNSWGRDCRPI